MALTYILIQEFVSSSTQAQFSFTSIPQTYSHLVLQIHGSSTTTATGFSGFNVQINGVTSNYAYQAINQTTTGTPFNNNNSARTAMECFRSLATQGDTNNSSTSILWIPGYANGAITKCALTYSAPTSLTPYTGGINIQSCYLPSSPVNSILITAQAGTFAAYSSARLYGLGS